MKMSPIGLNHDFSGTLPRLEALRYKNLLGLNAFISAATQAGLLVNEHFDRYLDELRSPPGITPPPTTAEVKKKVVELWGEVIKPAQCAMTPVPKQQIRELFGMLVRQLELQYQGFYQTVSAPPNQFESKENAAERAKHEVEEISREFSGNVAQLFVGEAQFEGSGVLPRELVTKGMVQAVLEVVRTCGTPSVTIPLFDSNCKPLMEGFELALWCDELLVSTTLFQLRNRGLQVEIAKSLELDIEGSLPLVLEVGSREYRAR